MEPMIVALFTFYRNFTVPSVVVSAVGWFFLIQSGSAYSIMFIFWMKAVTNVAMGAYTHFFRTNTYIFYHNLGISQQQLYGFAFFTDITIWILGSITIIRYLL